MTRIKKEEKRGWKSTIKKIIFTNEKMEMISISYKAICGLCEEESKNFKTKEEVQMWLKDHIEKKCQVAKFLLECKKNGINTMGEAASLLKGD